MLSQAFAGIDVSLDCLVVAVADLPCWDKPRQFANDGPGRRRLLRFLTQCGHELHVCLEPTSTYHQQLCQMLDDDPRCTVYAADPKKVKDFISSRRKGVKTDHTDARELVEYLKRMQPQPWQPPRPAALALRCLARRCEEVTRRCTALCCRRHAANRGIAPKALLSDLARELKQQRDRRRRLRQEMLKLVATDEQLQLQYHLLLTVVGVGEVMALRLLSELACLPQGLGKRQWVSAAGLYPKPCESGKSQNKPRRLSKRGNIHLRQALFIPALVAAQHCPEVKRYYQQLQQRTAAKLAAVCAVMRKLLQAIWGMFQTNSAFNPALFHRP